MAAMNGKRRLEGKEAAVRDPKRPRVGKINSDDVQGGLTGSLAVPKRHVKLDDLQWKAVSMPDRLEDVEGFFGLEEIENVDVIQTGRDGQVEYRLAETIPPKTIKSTPAGGEGHKNTEGNEPEWEGFSDEPSQDFMPDSKPDTTERSRKPKKTPKKTAKRAAGETAAVKSLEITSSNAFAGLESEALDGETVDVSAWDSLGISSDVLASISKLGFSKPTPIQTASIPTILAGHDVIGKASTGSGKTLAFGIPILEYFHSLPRINRATKNGPDEARPAPSALVLSPTRELAHQLSTHLTALCSNYTGRDRPFIATITGGLSVQKQRRQLSTADVIIGTPGRLWEIISAGHGVIDWLRRVKFLVVDEADRLLSEGHFKEFEEILNVLDEDSGSDSDSESDTSAKVDTPGKNDDNATDTYEASPRPERQTLVFSATFHKGLQQKLSGRKRSTSGGDVLDQKASMTYLLQKLKFREQAPKFIDVNPSSQMADNLHEGVVECSALEKDLYLYAVLLYHPNRRTLIFTNSISSVRRVTPLLQNLGLPAANLHSQMAQKARLRSIERFTASNTTSSSPSILVATDVAARGLDIPSVDLIIHYHLPRAADTYVHRSGRTARSGTSGKSILLCAPSEVPGVRRLVAKVHARTSKSTTTATPRGQMRTLDLNRRVVARLAPRVRLAKKIADSMLAKEKAGKDDVWLREAADDLGLEWDSDTMEVGTQGIGKKGRGTGRVKREKEARSLTKAELAVLKAELKAELGERINVGVSETYITGGAVDIDALLRERDGGEGSGSFLGKVEGVGL